jgi:hypothetical protein
VRKEARKAAAKSLDYDLKHLATSFQMLFYPFLQLDDFKDISKPMFEHDNPVRFGDANLGLGLASELFFWIPVSLHQQLIEGEVFSHKVKFLHIFTFKPSCIDLVIIVC